MSDDFENIIISTENRTATRNEVRENLEEKKNRARTTVHNIFIYFLMIAAGVLIIGLVTCIIAYFCYIIRDVPVPNKLEWFVLKIGEWTLVSFASFGIAMKIKGFCE